MKGLRALEVRVPVCVEYLSPLQHHAHVHAYGKRARRAPHQRPGALETRQPKHVSRFCRPYMGISLHFMTHEGVSANSGSSAKRCRQAYSRVRGHFCWDIYILTTGQGMYFRTQCDTRANILTVLKISVLSGHIKEINMVR